MKPTEVIEILQMEDSTRQTLTGMNFTVQRVNYVSYEKKKSKGTKKQQKPLNNSNISNSNSSSQKQDSTKQCYQCKKPYTKGHENVCKTRNARCTGCGTISHYQVTCKKFGNFPQKPSSNSQNSNSTGRMNVALSVQGAPLSLMREVFQRHMSHPRR